MIALRALAKIVAAALALSCGSLDARGKPAGKSLIAGWWARDKVVGPQCLDLPLCMQGLLEIRLEDTRTLSGPTVPETLVVSVATHGRPLTEYRQVVLVIWRGNGKAWKGFLLAAARPGGEACFEREALEEFSAPVPRNARAEKDRICVIA